MSPHRWTDKHTLRVDSQENHTLRDYTLAETVCIKQFEITVTSYTKDDEPIQEKIAIKPGTITADSRGRGFLQNLHACNQPVWR